MTSETVTARERIAERVKNAYAAGYNDGRKGIDRMDEVAETETARIVEVAAEWFVRSNPDIATVSEEAIKVMVRDMYGRMQMEMMREINPVLMSAFGADTTENGVDDEQ